MLYIANKMECFSFKSGCVVRLAKRFKENWFIDLRVQQLQLKATLCIPVEKFYY